jgi:translation initiation factor IF-3
VYLPTLDILRPKMNSQITAATLRVIDERGEAIGVMSRDEALTIARERGIDLIEIVPNAQPPVAKIISFDKYRYQKEKAIKKERSAQKSSGLKQIQISGRAAVNDLQTKLRKLHEFLDEGHQVEIQMRLRGREKYNKPWAMQKLEEFLKMITIDYKIMSPAKFGGRGIQIYITKKK